MQSFHLLDFIGLGGAGLVVLAYYKISTGAWSDKEKRYHWTNIAGALAICASLFSSFNYSTLVLQIVWIGVAVLRLRSL